MIVYILFTFVAVCLYTDLTKRKIYNLVVLLGLVSALILHVIDMGIISGAAYTMTGFFTGLLLLLIPFMLGGLGAGDVKMLAMVGAFVGSSLVVPVMLASAVAGGVYAMIVMLKSKTLIKRMKNIFIGIYCAIFIRNKDHLETLEDSSVTQQAIPYGAAISTGVLIIYIMGAMDHAVSIASAAKF
jgi:prepilin peptidase CpaA